MGDNNIKLLKKICASEAYSSNHNYFTLDKKISKGKIFQNQIRECALELVYSLAKSSPSAIKKSNNFKNNFLP